VVQPLVTAQGEVATRGSDGCVGRGTAHTALLAHVPTLGAEESFGGGKARSSSGTRASTLLKLSAAKHGHPCAESWRWGSLAQWIGRQCVEETARLSDWPLPRPSNWVELVNQPQTEAELEALRKCVTRGRPFGDKLWQTTTAERLGLGFTLRPRGRPRSK